MESTVSTTTSPNVQKTPTVAEIPIKLFGANGSNPLPMLEKLWDFYSLKGIKTVFISVGTSSSPLGELEIAETLGCPLHVIEYDNEKLNNWEKVVKILKSREESEETKCDFTSEVKTKWVLPKNVRISNKLPSFYNGTILVKKSNNSDEQLTVETVTFDEYVEKICLDMNIGKGNSRIDLLNIQVGNELELHLLYAFINNNYRPGMIIVNYTNSPDTNLLSTLAAGHLQNIGYALIGIENSKLLYVYNDKNIYEYCSWENKKVDNPLIIEIIKSIEINSRKK